MIRGLPAERMRPKFELDSAAVGFEKFAWLRLLNTSHRILIRRLSLNRNSLSMPASRFCKPGPMSILRPLVPKVPRAGTAKALVLKYRAILLAVGWSLYVTAWPARSPRSRPTADKLR